MLWGKGHNILSEQKKQITIYVQNDPNFVRKISILCNKMLEFNSSYLRFDYSVNIMDNR